MLGFLVLLLHIQVGGHPVSVLVVGKMRQTVGVVSLILSDVVVDLISSRLHEAITTTPTTP